MTLPVLDFLSSIGDTLLLIINVVISFFSGLITVVTMIPRFVSLLTIYIASLPSYVVPFITAGILLSVVYLLVGRNS